MAQKLASVLGVGRYYKARKSITRNRAGKI